MKAIHVYVLTVVVIGAAAVPAFARPKAPPAQASIQEVTVTGCIAKGAASFCSKMKAEDGKTYSFAGQPVVEGKCYTITGKQTMGTCREGIQLGVSKVIAAPVDCCPKP